MSKENDIILRPGNNGIFCPGNGDFKDENGEPIECRCDECDYYLLCFDFERHEACEDK